MRETLCHGQGELHRNHSTAVSGFTASKDTPKGTTTKTQDERIMKSGLMNYFTEFLKMLWVQLFHKAKLTLENGVVCKEE